MKKGPGRTLLIVIMVSMVAAIIMFAAIFSMFDIGAMFSSANDSQTSPTSTNGTANYTLDDHGFVSWLNSTNSSVSALVSDIRTDGEKFDMTNVSILCVELQNRTNGYLADIEKFNLTADLQNISAEYKTALNDFKNGASYAESAAAGSGMEDVSTSMNYFMDGAKIASNVMNEVKNVPT